MLNIERVYNIRQASDILGIKVRTVREWIKSGRIKAYKYTASNRWYITENELERLKAYGNED